eukprot:TRINITY_DN1547_c0_g1_i1.p1 TRINITY_DN1547_c0_g1~~TRINITY_DN1547_c0_g1_i1.p1  ORF type:complete len:520 (-),score=126.68 TRINITY_DN1547_c0_g1_i1:81-1640(-)
MFLEFAREQPLVGSLIVTAVTLLFYYLWTRKQRLEADAHRNALYPPEVPGQLPILGHAIELSKGPRDFFDKWGQVHPKAFTINLVGKKFVVLSGEYTKEYFKLADNVMSFDEAVKVLLAMDLTLGVESVDFPFHIELTKSKFTTNLKYFLPILTEQVKSFFARKVDNAERETNVAPLNGGGICITDTKAFSTELIALFTSRCLFGPEIYNKPELLQSVMTFHTEIDAVSSASILLPKFISKLKSRSIQKYYELWENLLYPVIERRRKAMREAAQNGKTYEQFDFLQFLLEAKNPDGSEIDKKIVVNRMGAMIFAALSVSAIALHNFLCWMAQRPDVREKIYNEQRDVIKVMREQGPSSIPDEDVTYSKAALERMKYLDAAVREALRLRRVHMSSPRMAMEDVALGDLVLPKGSFVTINAWAIHTNEAKYPNPEKFDPDRFLQSEAITSNDYVIFGLGKHTCPGKFFAFHMLKCIGAHVIRNFELSVKDNQTTTYVYYNGVQGDLSNVPLVLRKRSDSLE